MLLGRLILGRRASIRRRSLLCFLKRFVGGLFLRVGIGALESGAGVGG